MRTFLRAVAGVNALFQGLVGLLSIASPETAAGLFQLPGLPPAALALVRMFGGLLVGSALLSGWVAKSPEANPTLPLAVALACLVNLAADTLVILSGAMQLSQLALGMLLQAVLVGAVFANLRGGLAVAPR